MKRINGTITLSFVEEDNKQRVIFRVVPLCTREGVTFRDAKEYFPDQGSLRVVPDKREQSTFKERMHEIGALCVVELLQPDGKELVKVRQNRNYDPGQGEYNQYAIYSDVIQEFSPDSVFEVIEWSEQAAQPMEALTPTVLLLSNKVLYGPVPSNRLEGMKLEELKPFGNDQFLLHTVELPDGSAHSIYWNPEATVNWRERRGSLRRKSEKNPRLGPEMPACSESGQEDFAPQSEAVIPAASLEAAERPVKELSMRAGPDQGDALEPYQDTPSALPIGTKLEILDTDIPFEQQISRLDQPLPESANRLATSVDTLKLEDAADAHARYSGTPFVRDRHHMLNTISRPEPLHHVVERQMRVGREERMSSGLGGETASHIENPVDRLLTAVDSAWQSKETREQAIAALLENQGFAESILEAFRKKGQNVHAVAAAYAQLEDIEAERLSLLMQLDQAKEAKRRFQEQVIASASQKKQEEIEKLNEDIQALIHQKEELCALVNAESKAAMAQAASALGERFAFFGGVDGEGRVLLSPVMGVHRAIPEMTEAIRLRLCSYGFPVGEDDAMILLTAFSLFPSLCFQGENLADMELFAMGFLEALGLQNVSAVVREQTKVQIASLLAESDLRSPTVTIQRFGTDTVNVFGHKTIFLATESNTQAGIEASLFPEIRIPKATGAKQAQSVEMMPPIEPASLSSLMELTGEIHPLLDEGERWFEELKSRFDGNMISDAMLLSMRRFVAVSSRKIRGGFLAAADAAACQWVIPRLLRLHLDVEAVRSVFGSLPHALDTLGIR